MIELRRYGIIPRYWNLDERQEGMVLTLITDVSAVHLPLSQAQAETLRDSFERGRKQMGRYWKDGELRMPAKEHEDT